MKEFRISLLLGLISLLMVSGCGGETGPKTVRVWGQVQMDGKPIEDGKITLTPTGDTPGASVAGMIKDGKYDIPATEGPVEKGNYKVEISALSKKGKALPNVVDPGGPSLAVFEELIPAKYNSDSTLSLAVSANEEENKKDFELKK